MRHCTPGRDRWVVDRRLSIGTGGAGVSISSLDPLTGEARELAALGHIIAGSGLTVSPDAQWILYVQDNAFGGDVLLVDGFK